MNWLKRLKRVSSWTAQEWRLFGEAWAALLAARFAIRRWQMGDVLEHLQGVARSHDQREVLHEPIVRAVQRATHLHIVPMLCLPQSVAISWMLARRGIACEFVIGARPKEGQLDAHAWVEREGVPINSPLDSAQRHPVFLREPILASS